MRALLRKIILWALATDTVVKYDVEGMDKLASGGR